MTDPIPPPRAKKSYHTVLCLDISESMRKGDAYKMMVEIVHKFLDGKFCLYLSLFLPTLKTVHLCVNFC